MDLKTLIKTPKTQLGFILTILFFSVALHNFSLNLLLLFIVATGSTLTADIAFLKLRKVPLYFPSASLVTGVIIALLSDPHLSYFIPMIAGVCAMFVKNILRVNKRHIFNPAAIGLLITSFIVNIPVPWSGVSWQFIKVSDPQSVVYFLILLSPAYISLYKMRRFVTTVSFIVMYITLNQLLHLRLVSLDVLLNPIILFFAITMLPEPMTSPISLKRQLLYGTTVAILSMIVSLPIFGQLSDPLLIPLLIGNLLFFKLR